MTSHLTEEQLVDLLQGTLAANARDEAKRHLGTCVSCADALAREAALDAVLWEARHSLVEKARAAAPADAGRAAAPPDLGRPTAPKTRRQGGRAWLWGAGAIGIATATALGYASTGGTTSTSVTASLGVLAWQNVIFYIPLAVGLLLILGSAFGLHDHDHDASHAPGHHGESHGGGHDGHDSLFVRGLAVLGLGRVPLTVLFMTTSLSFGGLGMILNTLFSSAGLVPSFYGPISVAGAFVGMVALSGATARLIHRYLPTSESYPVSRHDFAGCTGTLLVPADGSSGYAQIKDAEGNVHNIKCHTMGGALPKGTAILVVEYDEGSQTFVVDANPEPPLP
jgi:membrane protein implicated in regulation of membrane protease activity